MIPCHYHCGNYLQRGVGGRWRVKIPPEGEDSTAPLPQQRGRGIHRGLGDGNKVAIQYQWDRQFHDSRVRQVTSVLPGGMAAKKKENGNDFTTVPWVMFMGSRKMPLRTLAPTNANKNGVPAPLRDSHELCHISIYGRLRDVPARVHLHQNEPYIPPLTHAMLTADDLSLATDDPPPPPPTRTLSPSEGAEQNKARGEQQTFHDGILCRSPAVGRHEGRRRGHAERRKRAARALLFLITRLYEGPAH